MYKIRHIAIRADDQKKVAEFYKRTFGMKEVRNDGEDKKNPLSDLEIVRILKDKYRINAARRTIAKYREEMEVPSSRLRKQY